MFPEGPESNRRRIIRVGAILGEGESQTRGKMRGKLGGGSGPINHPNQSSEV